MKPCPFCGSRDVVGCQFIDKVRIECQKCSAIGPFAVGETVEERRRGAEKLWDMRGGKFPKVKEDGGP